MGFSKSHVSDHKVICYLRTHGEKKLAYRFNWLPVERRTKIRARVKAALEKEQGK